MGTLTKLAVNECHPEPREQPMDSSDKGKEARTNSCGAYLRPPELALLTFEAKNEAGQQKSHSVRSNHQSVRSSHLEHPLQTPLQALVFPKELEFGRYFGWYLAYDTRPPIKTLEKRVIKSNI